MLLKTRFPMQAGLEKKLLVVWKFYMYYPQLSLRKGYWMSTQPSGYTVHMGNFHFLLLLLSNVLIVHFILFFFFKLRKVVIFWATFPCCSPWATSYHHTDSVFPEAMPQAKFTVQGARDLSHAEINFTYYRKTCKAKSNKRLIPGKVWKLVWNSSFSYRVVCLLRPRSHYGKGLGGCYLEKE